MMQKGFFFSIPIALNFASLSSFLTFIYTQIIFNHLPTTPLFLRRAQREENRSDGVSGCAFEL
jgi:hypothetical protein